MSRHTLKFICSICIACLGAQCIAPPSAAAEQNLDDLSNWVTQLMLLNRIQPIEGAGSMGAYGTKLGLSTSLSQQDHANGSFISESSPRNSQAQSWPRLWLSKGTAWPVTFGLSAAQTIPHGALLVGGYAQVTLYEALARPAIALRIGHSRSYGLSSTSIRTHQADLVTSFGFMRYFEVFAGAGFADHKVDVVLHEDSPSAYLMTAIDQSVERHAIRHRPSHQFVGLKLMGLLPLTTLAAEIEQRPEHLEWRLRAAVGY